MNTYYEKWLSYFDLAWKQTLRWVSQLLQIQEELHHLCRSMPFSPTTCEECKHTRILKGETGFSFWHSSIFCEWKVDRTERGLERGRKGDSRGWMSAGLADEQTELLTPLLKVLKGRWDRTRDLCDVRLKRDICPDSWRRRKADIRFSKSSTRKGKGMSL